MAGPLDLTYPPDGEPGGGGGGGAATIADGADSTQGAVADASVAGGAAGTISAKLRRLTADIAALLTSQTDGTQITKLQAGTTAIGSQNTNADARAVDSGNVWLQVLGRLTVFNGTTWDRQRGNTFGTFMAANAARNTILASAARTATNNSAQLDVTNYRDAIVTLNVTAASGTTPTLNVKLQTSDDGGTTWYDLPNASFTQATAITAQAIQISNFGDTIRAVSTIAGTTPSFTYAIKMVGK